MPFCHRKCFYCSFVVAVGQEKRAEQYLDCMRKEAQEYRDTEIHSLYVGGGTPTVLSSAQLEELFSFIHDTFIISSNTEITVEANPEGLDLEKLRILKQANVNRISLGVQTFDDSYLKYLGRNHDSETAIKTYHRIREFGFTNISLDMMYGFPDQTAQEIQKDVEAFAQLQSDHLSLYSLIIEEDSRFYIKNIQLPETHVQSDHYQDVCQLIEQKGYAQYEVSNFAKKGFESQHNLHYWFAGNYIGLGVGAHSHKDGVRTWNTSSFSEYLKLIRNNQSVCAGREQLTNDQRMLEEFLFGLRMSSGVDLKFIEQKYDLSMSDERKHMLKALVDEELLINGGNSVRTTMKGRLLLDEICARFI